MEKEITYKGKWIVFQPSSGTRHYLSRIEVVYVYKETAKQVKCSSSDRGVILTERTIQKSNILGIVKCEDVDKIRRWARETQNLYLEKTNHLYVRYKNIMLNYPK